MPDFLTRRNGVWHFVRRVPAEFAAFDRRGIIKHSTRVQVSTDRDKSSSLSATVNKYLLENGLRPTKAHTVYSLRHSFKDRLVAAEAPDSLIDNLMGHRTGKPKYGEGPPPELKRKFLDAIALSPVSEL